MAMVAMGGATAEVQGEEEDGIEESNPDERGNH